MMSIRNIIFLIAQINKVCPYKFSLKKHTAITLTTLNKTHTNQKQNKTTINQSQLPHLIKHLLNPIHLPLHINPQPINTLSRIIPTHDHLLNQSLFQQSVASDELQVVAQRWQQ